MNFIRRSTVHVPEEKPHILKSNSDSLTPSDASTLESLITDDPYTHYSERANSCRETDDIGGENGIATSTYLMDVSRVSAKHSDVSEDEGWITIPDKELPESWNQAPDIRSLRSLDRPFVFPGEQVHILACLSACKQDTETITPFKVAAVMSKSSLGEIPEKENGKTAFTDNLPSQGSEAISDDQHLNKENFSNQKFVPKEDVSSSKSFLKMEDHKRQTEKLLQKFENSHFFVRIAESGDPLWSKRTAVQNLSSTVEMGDQKSLTSCTMKNVKNMSQITAVVDRGNFDATVSGGAARSSIKCSVLPNGDIVVLLQVNVGVDYLKDPFIEILQFERCLSSSLESDDDPCGELLKWLLPLDNTLSSPARPLSPPHLRSNTGASASQRSHHHTSSGTQLFSIGHFRSHSMSSIPQNKTPPLAHVKAVSFKPSFDLEDWDQISSQKLLLKKDGIGSLLSFRGVSMERERLSVRCGLEGVYTPGRRWSRKLDIIEPVKIRSFTADCNAEDVFCVQIKNIVPEHAPEIIVYIDAITVVYDEASQSGPLSSLPVACIEVGNDHCLPGLALRRGEEHSFILKPEIAMQKNFDVHSERGSRSSKPNLGKSKIRTKLSSLSLLSKSTSGKKNTSKADRYAIMVSCRCNYTESTLFFKQPTSWQPRVSRDIMVSVASDMSEQYYRHEEINFQFPVQVLTLQTSNLTSEDLTMTVLAPASFSSLPSVVLLNSPSSPMSPFVRFPEVVGRDSSEKQGAICRRSSDSLASESYKKNARSKRRLASIDGHSFSLNDIIPGSGLGCTHLWLQNRVPLGCIPSRSMATLKLQLLPLTDGIITLDTLQIAVKEKGLTYVPECSLKINATSSISTGIL